MKTGFDDKAEPLAEETPYADAEIIKLFFRRGVVIFDQEVVAQEAEVEGIYDIKIGDVVEKVEVVGAP